MEKQLNSELIIEYQLTDLEVVAKQLLSSFDAKVICLTGEMGSGKTTLVKALIKHLGAEDTGSSPTFSVVNEYLTTDFSIFHMDLYRLKSTEEIFDIGFFDYLQENSRVLIEWPELILQELEAYLHIHLDYLEEKRRLTAKFIHV